MLDATRRITENSINTVVIFEDQTGGVHIDKNSAVDLPYIINISPVKETAENRPA